MHSLQFWKKKYEHPTTEHVVHGSIKKIVKKFQLSSNILVRNRCSMQKMQELQNNTYITLS